MTEEKGESEDWQIEQMQRQRILEGAESSAQAHAAYYVQLIRSGVRPRHAAYLTAVYIRELFRMSSE